MIFDLRIIYVMQSVSLFHEIFHCFVVLQFRKTCRYRDTKQTERFAKRPPVSLVFLFQETEIIFFYKNPCLVAWSQLQLLYFAIVLRTVPHFAVSMMLMRNKREIWRNRLFTLFRCFAK
jgi:hypothetical protein